MAQPAAGLIKYAGFLRQRVLNVLYLIYIFFAGKSTGKYIKQGTY
jgi:hypothetical protein